jgi:hypothetical protein
MVAFQKWMGQEFESANGGAGDQHTAVK